MRLTVSMTGKKWLNGSVAHEPSRRGDSLVRVSRKVLPFSRRTISKVTEVKISPAEKSRGG